MNKSGFDPYKSGFNPFGQSTRSECFGTSTRSSSPVGSDGWLSMGVDPKGIWNKNI